MVISREPQHLAIRTRGHSVDIRPVTTSVQHLPALGRNHSNESNSFAGNGYHFPENHLKVAGGSASSIQAHRPSSVGAATLRPPSVDPAMRPVFTRNTSVQRSGTPQVTANRHTALGQSTLPVPQRRSETPQSFGGPTRTGPRPTGTVAISSTHFPCSPTIRNPHSRQFYIYGELG